MATIRTQLVGSERRIITKVVNGQRRVSCSCCDEAECCMYPAEELGVGFAEEDLPDELQFNVTLGGVSYQLVAQKNASPYGLYWWPIGNTSYVLRFEDGAYQLETQETINIEDGFTGLGSQRCLVDDPSVANPILQDTFADTYTVTTNQATGVVTRQSLCIWTGVDNLGCDLELRYEDRASPPRSGSRYKWTVDFAESGLTPCAERAIAIKTPNQNTPVGSYDAGVSVA
jgi:hypothetical protein